MTQWLFTTVRGFEAVFDRCCELELYTSNCLQVNNSRQASWIPFLFFLFVPSMIFSYYATGNHIKLGPKIKRKHITITK